MGVFSPSSRLTIDGVATCGLRSSDGYVADTGVLRAGRVGFAEVAAMAGDVGVSTGTWRGRVVIFGRGQACRWADVWARS